MAARKLNQARALRDAERFGLRVEYSSLYKGVATKDDRRAIAPVGQLAHHTGTKLGKRSFPTRRMLEVGHSKLRGPLANAGIGADGLVLVITDRRANHGGIGLKSVVDLVRTGRAPGGKARRAGTIVVNGYYCGVEVDNDGDGRHPFPSKQVDAWVTYHAMIALDLRQSAEQVIGHLESTSRKIDPRFTPGANPSSMVGLRSLIARRMITIASIRNAVVSTQWWGAPLKLGDPLDWRVARVRKALGIRPEVDGGGYGLNVVAAVKAFQISKGASVSSPHLGHVGEYTARLMGIIK